MIATGCIMARVCHTNNCPVGVASQREELRARFPGELSSSTREAAPAHGSAAPDLNSVQQHGNCSSGSHQWASLAHPSLAAGAPDDLVNYFHFVAEEVRAGLAALGLRSLDQLIGRADLLRQVRALGLQGKLACPGWLVAEWLQWQQSRLLGNWASAVCRGSAAPLMSSAVAHTGLLAGPSLTACLPCCCSAPRRWPRPPAWICRSSPPLRVSGLAWAAARPPPARRWPDQLLPAAGSGLQLAVCSLASSGD